MAVGVAPAPPPITRPLAASAADEASVPEAVYPRIPPEVQVDRWVPPLATGKMPLMSVARLTAANEGAPVEFPCRTVVALPRLDRTVGVDPTPPPRTNALSVSAPDDATTPLDVNPRTPPLVPEVRPRPPFTRASGVPRVNVLSVALGQADGVPGHVWPKARDGSRNASNARGLIMRRRPDHYSSTAANSPALGWWSATPDHPEAAIGMPSRSRRTTPARGSERHPGPRRKALRSSKATPQRP